jgi:hypothetical protein
VRGRNDGQLTKRLAERELRPCVDAANNYQPTAARPQVSRKAATLFSEFAAVWLEKGLVHRKASTKYGMRCHIKAHLIPAFGRIPMGDLESERVQSFVNQLAERRSPKTLLAGFLDPGVSCGRISDSVTGREFGEPRKSFAGEAKREELRLGDADRSRSLASAGTRDGLFRVVYRFENEQLVELINSTAHAAALSALVETGNTYRFYFGVYVRNVGRFTPFYMALIDPFRKLIVYPSLLHGVRVRWNRAFGGA